MDHEPNGPDNRPFPRWEPCWACGTTPCDRLNPADQAVCQSCHNELASVMEEDYARWCGTLRLTPEQMREIIDLGPFVGLDDRREEQGDAVGG